VRNPLKPTWRDRSNRPFVPKPYKLSEPPPLEIVRTPGLDALAAWLRELRQRLRG